MADNWKNRAGMMICGTCMWFVPKMVVIDACGKTAAEGAKFEKGQSAAPSRLGRGRRHAPTMGGYPAVFETDWCCGHKLDEGKI